MRILVVSDTHGKHGGFDKALEEAGKIDFLIHLGDTEGGEFYIEAACGCPAYILAGNCDFFSHNLREMEIDFGGKKVFMTHGHCYQVRSGVERIAAEGKARGADVVMFGHTHKPFLEVVDGITVLNPGSIAFPRQTDKKASYALMQIDARGKATFEIRYL